ncbi:hypothetical protein J6S37_01110 [Candidatus Saccharibacteria bacterium]|nr:hypothetical protein [Candidatus Saccharibacteria bacterium]
MISSTKTIELTDKLLESLKTEDFLAITIAEGGAMGDPGAIEIVDKDLKLYHTHFGEIDDDLLRNKIPFLETLRIGFGEIEGLDRNWTGLYTGYGNYLFVKPEYEKPILKYIEDHYSDTGMPMVVELYSHWYDALKQNGAANET